jgi:hypothetical protein
MNKNIILLGILCLILLEVAYAADSYVIDSEILSGKENQLLNSKENRVSMLIPALFVLITIISFMVDFGTIGIVLGSMFGLGVTVMIGLIALDLFSIIGFIIMGGVLIFKLAGS